MKIKSILAVGILVVAAPVTAFAGDKNHTDLVKSLNLKGDRAEQVEKIQDQYEDQAKQVKEKAKDEIDKLREQKHDQLKAVLSEKEFKQYESIKEAHKEKKEHWAEKCEEHHEKVGG